MIAIKEINYGNFGRCVQVSNGTVDFVATLDLGPRIIRFGFVGGDNEFFEDVDNKVAENGDDFKEKFDSDIGWKIYGGHRLWAAPEILPRNFYPDNDPVKYEEIPSGIRLMPPPQKWTNLQMEMEVTIASDGSVDVTHKITNIGAWNCEFAVWALSVMAQNGLEVVPLSAKDTGLSHNRRLIIWPYTNITDKRGYWGDKYATVRQDMTATGPFKFGTNCDDGWAAYFNHGNLFVKYFPADGVHYTDGGVNYETYTNAHMLEMESLSELKNVAPGETITHWEKWKLFANVTPPAADDEAGISAVMSKVLG